MYLYLFFFELTIVDYKMNSILKENSIFFVMLMFAFTIQTFLIFPIESSIRSDKFAHIASYIFIPHGVKVLCCMFIGPMAILPIFFAQVLNYSMLTGLQFDLHAIESGLVGSICVALPVAVLNMSRNKKWSNPMFFTGDLNYFWAFISLALISSLINTFGHTLLYGSSNHVLGFRFIIGDLVGSFVIISILLLCFRMLKNGKS